MEFRLIPFGESVTNLELCVKYNVIGLTKRTNISEGERLYFTVKRGSKWRVCGRAKFLAETEDNPFDNPGRYYTYSVKDIEACTPFEINTVLKDQLGAYWGLVFQSPRIIENESIQKYIEENFKTVDYSKMINALNA